MKKGEGIVTAMLRVNVTPETDEKLRAFAKETDNTIAWHVRQAIKRYLEEEER